MMPMILMVTASWVCMTGAVASSPSGGFRGAAGRHPPVVQKDVDVARRAAQAPQQQRDLSPVMHAVNGGMVHQLSKPPQLLRTIAE